MRARTLKLGDGSMQEYFAFVAFSMKEFLRM